MADSTTAKMAEPEPAAGLREDLLDALIFFRSHEGSMAFLPFSHEAGWMQTRIVQRGGVGQRAMAGVRWRSRSEWSPAEAQGRGGGRRENAEI